jgi:hypothetical protein
MKVSKTSCTVIEADLLFYRGWWYRPHGGHWFRARAYQGPWVFLHPTKRPRPLLSRPSDYRRIPPGHQKIPYGQLKKKCKDKEESPPKMKKAKGPEGGVKGGPKDKKDKGPKGGPPGKQEKNQGTYLESRPNKSN